MPDAIYPDRKWTNYCRYGERQQEHGRQGMKSTPEICWRRDDHYLTNQYQTQKKYKNPKKYQQDRNCKKMFVNKRAIYLKFTVRVWKLVTS